MGVVSAFWESVIAVDSGLPWRLPRNPGEKLRVAQKLHRLWKANPSTEQELLHWASAYSVVPEVQRELRIEKVHA